MIEGHFDFPIPDHVDLTPLFAALGGGAFPPGVRFVRGGGVSHCPPGRADVTFVFGAGAFDLLEVDGLGADAGSLVLVREGPEALPGLRAMVAAPGFGEFLEAVRREPSRVAFLEVERSRFWRVAAKAGILPLHRAGGFVFRLLPVPEAPDLPRMQSIHRDWEARRSGAAVLQRHLIEYLIELRHTALSETHKRDVFEAAFPGVAPRAGAAGAAPGAAPEAGRLRALRQAVFGPELADHPPHYAAALVYMADLANFEVHSGHARRYFEVLGCDAKAPLRAGGAAAAGPAPLVCVPDPGGPIQVGQLAPAQWRALRRDYAALYLRVRYRVPADYLIAVIDCLPTPEDWRAAEEAGTATLAALVIDEADLAGFEQHRHAQALLFGSLYHASLYRGRATGDAAALARAECHAENALALARVEEVSHHTNYWVGAALSRHVFDPVGAPWADHAGYRRLVAALAPYPVELAQTLDDAHPDFYKLLFFAMAWAVEEILGDDDTRGMRRLADEHRVLEHIALSLVARFADHHGPEGYYALHAATGYLALATRARGEDTETLRAALDTAIAYARKLDADSPAAVIPLLGLRSHLLRLAALGDTMPETDRVAAAIEARERLRSHPSAPHYPELEAFFHLWSQAKPPAFDARKALELAFRLPY